MLAAPISKYLHVNRSIFGELILKLFSLYHSSALQSMEDRSACIKKKKEKKKFLLAVFQNLNKLPYLQQTDSLLNGWRNWKAGVSAVEVINATTTAVSYTHLRAHETA